MLLSKEELAVAEPEELIEGALQDKPAQEVQADEEASEELQECPDHHPSSFERESWYRPQDTSCKILESCCYMNTEVTSSVMTSTVPLLPWVCCVTRTDAIFLDRAIRKHKVLLF